MIRPIAAILGLGLLAACVAEPVTVPPEVSLTDMSLQDATLLESRAQVQLRVRNPNETALTVDGLRFALEVNGRPFAHGMSGRHFTVPRLGEADTEAEATISTFDIVGQVVAAQNAEDVRYRLSGTLLHAGGWVPFEQSGRLNLPGLVWQGR